MSTSLLYHAFGLRDHHQRRIEFRGGQAVFHVERARASCRCSACGSADVSHRGQLVRSFRALPIGRRPTFIALPIPRVECRRCGVVRQVEISFADPRRTYTRAFERYALELGRRMTIRDVAVHLGVGWDTIQDILKRDLARRFAKPKLKHLVRIAIDEFAVARGHRYMTTVLDLDSGAIVFVGDGKAGSALEPFWRRLRPSGAKIQAVAMDMSAAYRKAVKENLPKAAIVFDHFHISKLFNEKLTELRRELHREATDALRKRVLKGARWLILKDPANLDQERDEKRRLKEALRLNEPLAAAYYMKEELRWFWRQPGKTFATHFLDGWLKRAQASGIKVLHQMAKTLALYRSGLLAYYDAMITSGPLEGTNNKIKTLKRTAYGFRDHEFFKLKILALHETRYELVG
jgi:transposase